MSTDVTSLPPWKLALLERKRVRQDGETSGTTVGVVGVSNPQGNEIGSEMPSWKREIILKKQQQSNSLVFIARPTPATGLENEMSPKLDIVVNGMNKTINRRSVGPHDNYSHHVFDSNSTYGNAIGNSRTFSESSISTAEERGVIAVSLSVQEERLLPINKNPILLLDYEKRHHGGGSSSHSPSSSLGTPVGMISEMNGSNIDVAVMPVSTPRTVTDVDISGLDDDGMTYGKGFVHRLLKRFSGMAGGKEELTNRDLFPVIKSPKRSHSSTDVTRYVTGSASRQYPDRQPKKCLTEVTRSCDDLLNDTFSSTPVQSMIDCSSKFSRLSDGSQFMTTGNVSASTRDGSLEMCESGNDDKPQVNIVSNVRTLFESFKTSPRRQKIPVGRSNNMTDRNSSEVRTVRSFNVAGGRSSASGRISPRGDILVGKEQVVPVAENGNVGNQLILNPLRDAVHPHPKNILKEINTSPESFRYAADMPSVQSSVKKDINENETRLNTKSDDQGFQRSCMPDNDYVKRPTPNDDISSMLRLNDSGMKSTDQKVHAGADTKTTIQSSATSDSDVSSLMVPSVKLEKTCTTSDRDVKKIWPKITSPVSTPVASIATRKTAKELEPAVKPVLNVPSNNNINTEKPNNSCAPTTNGLADPIRTQRPTQGVLLGNASCSTASVKSPAQRQSPSRPGMLLIRPASNLVAAKTKTEFLELTKFNDVKNGEFAPATRHFASDEDGIINNDDYTEETEGEGYVDPRVDASVFEFIGAAVSLGRSLLTKTRRNSNLKIQFNDGAMMMFEYPSEQSLMEASPAQPGDCDFISITTSDFIRNTPDSNDDDADDNNISNDLRPAGQTQLKSTPALTSNNTAGALSSYKSRMQIDYQFGQYDNNNKDMSDTHKDPLRRNVDQQTSPPTPNTGQQETAAWSGTGTSDLLF